MNWQLAIGALAAVSLISLTFGYLGGRNFAEKRYAGPLQDFVLANRSLKSGNIIQLLLSTSFSLNGMLYQIWLGYTIGLWALAVQGVWALSYPWLAQYVHRVREAPSLHAFLGKRYGYHTRILAAACSVIGLTILVGWEFNIGRSIFAAFLSDANGANSLTYFMVATIVVSGVYTTMGGLGGDAFADTIQNIYKFLMYILIGSLLYLSLRATDLVTFKATLVTPLSTALASLGVFGFITNVAFSLVWQFVDMSCWQNVIASRAELSDARAKGALRKSGIAVFIAPGIIGTIIGALVLHSPTVTADNIMAKAIAALPNNGLLLFGIFAALLATIMSMVDGELLASAYAFACDIIFARTSITELDSDERKANKVLFLVRSLLFIFAIVGSLGVLALLEHGVTLFAVTYVLVIAQLALFGPVFFGLTVSESQVGDRMTAAIASGLIIGFGSWIGGQLSGLDWPTTGAGFFTIIASVATAWLLHLRYGERRWLLPAE